MENFDIETVPTVIALLLTVISPLISAWFTKQSMSPRNKNLVALGVSVVIALGWVILNGGFTTGEFAVAMTTVYGLQQFIYNQLLKEASKDVEAHKGLGKNEVVQPEPEAAEEASEEDQTEPELEDEGYDLPDEAETEVRN